MKRIDPLFFLCIGFTLILFMGIGCCVSQGELDTGRIFEYIIVGGVPGDNRIDNVLTINNEGVCWYKTLKAECSFMITQEEAQEIFEIVKNIARNSQKNTGGFIPDSLISIMRLYEKELTHEMVFYADESSGQMSPKLRRPVQFKRLEERLKVLIKSHCEIFNTPYFPFDLGPNPDPDGK